MADAGRNNGGNNRRNNNRNNRNNNRNNRNNNNYEEAEPNANGNRPAGSKNWRIKFANSRKVRLINKNGKSKALGTKHKTRTRRVLADHFPDEENVLNMIGKSSYASRVASEVGQLHAKHNTLEGMMGELEAKPMNHRIKSLVRTALYYKFYNLTGPPTHTAAVGNANNNLYK
jgi:hypothetical protein